MAQRRCKFNFVVSPKNWEKDRLTTVRAFTCELRDLVSSPRVMSWSLQNVRNLYMSSLWTIDLDHNITSKIGVVDNLLRGKFFYYKLLHFAVEPWNLLLVINFVQNAFTMAHFYGISFMLLKTSSTKMAMTPSTSKDTIRQVGKDNLGALL